MNRMTNTSDDGFLKILAIIFFMICTMVFFYYLYFIVKGYMACKSEMKEDLPCPNMCEPGYECKQSEAAADFVIGDVVQEEIIEEAPVDETPLDETPVEDAEVALAPLVEEKEDVEESPAVETTI